MSDQAPEPPPESTTDVRLRAVTKRVDRDFIIAVGTVLAVLGGFAAFILTTSSTYAQQARAELSIEVQSLRSDLERFKADSGAERLLVKRDMAEVQLDVRELYKVVQSGRRSARLEGEPTIVLDGGGGP